MRYSDFVKEKIFASYNLIHNFVIRDIENEEDFCEMKLELESNFICIPEHIANLLERFMIDVLEPIVYHEPENRLKELEQYRTVNDEGITEIKQGMEIEGVANYFKVVHDLEQELYLLAKTKLSPILCG